VVQRRAKAKEIAPEIKYKLNSVQERLVALKRLTSIRRRRKHWRIRLIKTASFLSARTTQFTSIHLYFMLEAPPER